MPSGGATWPAHASRITPCRWSNSSLPAPPPIPIQVGSALARKSRLARARQAEAAAPPAAGQPMPPPKHGWLGVKVEPAVVVADVRAGSPAQTAGLAQGDVITGINGVRVLDADELRKLVQETEAGE